MTIKKNSPFLASSWFEFSRINKIVISDKFKHNHKGFKYFIGYKGDNIVRSLCIILPQMSGYIKYFENRKKHFFHDWRW